MVVKINRALWQKCLGGSLRLCCGDREGLLEEVAFHLSPGE